MLTKFNFFLSLNNCIPDTGSQEHYTLHSHSYITSSHKINTTSQRTPWLADDGGRWRTLFNVPQYQQTSFTVTPSQRLFFFVFYTLSIFL